MRAKMVRGVLHVDDYAIGYVGQHAVDDAAFMRKLLAAVNAHDAQIHALERAEIWLDADHTDCDCMRCEDLATIRTALKLAKVK
jgi:hypothetical protein